MPNTRSEDMSDIFTPEGIQKLKKGQLLRFVYEGSTNEFIITSINKKSNKVYARRTTTYNDKEVTVTDAYGTESIKEYLDD
jgi:outer membrane lipoprotein-sorting protein